jgi:hypothetical protein
VSKVRVYELAQELGIESKTILSILKDMGEFVRSASSTLDPRLVVRIKQHLKDPTAAPVTRSAPSTRPIRNSTMFPRTCGSWTRPYQRIIPSVNHGVRNRCDGRKSRRKVTTYQLCDRSSDPTSGIAVTHLARWPSIYSTTI